MAWSLKTTDAAANCSLAVFVNEAGTGVVDLATSAPGTLEEGGGYSVTLADGSWNGTTRKYIQFPGTTASSNSLLGVDFGTGVLNDFEVQNATGKVMTVVALVDSWASYSNSYRSSLIGMESSADFRIYRNNYSVTSIPIACGGGTVNVNAGQIPTNAKGAAVFVVKQSQNGPAYWGLDTAGGVTAVTTTEFSALGPASAFKPRYIGKMTGVTGAFQGKLYGLLAFTTEKSESDLDTIAADPWTTMIDGLGGGSSVAPLAMVNFARMHNG